MEEKDYAMGLGVLACKGSPFSLVGDARFG